MKKIKNLGAMLSFLVIFSMLSCTKDKDDKNVTINQDLIGEWLRTDFSDTFEYTLVFQADHTGFRTELEKNTDGTETSSALSFDWVTNENQLTLDFNGEQVMTSFSINAEGQLLLTDVSEFPFEKID